LQQVLLQVFQELVWLIIVSTAAQSYLRNKGQAKEDELWVSRLQLLKQL